MEKRLNLKQLKEELNKIPDEKLKAFSISHDGYTEDPNQKIGLIFFDDEENWDKHFETIQLEPMQKISKNFVDFLSKDIEIIKLDEDAFNDEIDSGEFEDADWEY